METRLDHEIRLIREELDFKADLYKEAKARIDGTDEKWAAELKRSQDEMIRIIMHFDIDKGEDKASYCMGMLKMLARKIHAPSTVVADYESRQEMLARKIADRKERQDAEDGAELSRRNQSWRSPVRAAL